MNAHNSPPHLEFLIFHTHLSMAMPPNPSNLINSTSMRYRLHVQLIKSVSQSSTDRAARIGNMVYLTLKIVDKWAAKESSSCPCPAVGWPSSLPVSPQNDNQAGGQLCPRCLPLCRPTPSVSCNHPHPFTLVSVRCPSCCSMHGGGGIIIMVVPVQKLKVGPHQHEVDIIVVVHCIRVVDCAPDGPHTQ
jgi:hypothetical protein